MGQIFYGQANAIRTNAEIKAKQRTQTSGNIRRAAESELQRFSQALGNKKIMRAAEKNINAYGENIAKNLEAATFGDFMTQIQQSEELGAATAMAAAAGVGGSSIEAYSDTVNLNYALRGEQTDRQLKRDLYSASAARGEIMTSAVDSFDMNIYRPDLDVTQYVQARAPSTFGNILALGMAAGATYFGGPQAGSAVLSLREAQLAGNNGDFAGASQAMTSALSSALPAFKTTHELGGKYWGSTASKQRTDTGQDSNDIVITRNLPKWGGITF